MKSLVLLLTGGILIGSIAECEATKGAGKDLENTGENIQDALDKNK